MFWCWETRYSDHAITVNKLLPDDYKIYTSEDAELRFLFQEYKNWLLAQYICGGLSEVNITFRSYFSWGSRKYRHPKRLTSVFGGGLEECIFFLESADYFLSKCGGKIGDREIYNFACLPEERTLTDIGIVAHKIMLAASIARTTIGVHDEWRIEDEKKLLDKSLP